MTRRRLAPRRIAVLKPDFGVIGGFERVVERVEASLRRDGHQVTRLTVAVNELKHQPFGLAVPDGVWAQVPEYFRYLASIEAFEQLDTRGFDAVISTQPPSFANRHPRHLALFFHHHRIFYDLQESYLAAGLSAAPELHRQAAAKVRELDGPALNGVTWFLAGSETVRARLASFNLLDNVSLFDAGTDNGAALKQPATPTGAVLCVGRHEFPKRVELFVAAMKYLPELAAVSVGTGGREAWAKALDERLTGATAGLDALTDTDLWLNNGQIDEPTPSQPDVVGQTNLSFLGHVSDKHRDALYRAAPCVVAPALNEDYGLTALEALSHGTPVVVCSDGGGLANIVEHEVDGLVVEPTPKAIADAIKRIVDDPPFRAELSLNALAKAARTTWPRAEQQLRDALDLVLS